MPIEIDIIGGDGDDPVFVLNRWKKIGLELSEVAGEGTSKKASKVVGDKQTLYVSPGFASKWWKEIVRKAQMGLKALKQGNTKMAEVVIGNLESRIGPMPDDVILVGNNPAIGNLGEAVVATPNNYLDQDPRNPTNFSYGSGGTMNYGLRITERPISGSPPQLAPSMRRAPTNVSRFLVPEMIPETGVLMQSDFFDQRLEIGEIDDDDERLRRGSGRSRRPLNTKVVNAHRFSALPEDGSILGEGDDWGLWEFDDMGSILSKVKSSVSKVGSKVASGVKTAGSKVTSGAKTAGSAVKSGVKTVTKPVVTAVKTASDVATTAVKEAGTMAKATVEAPRKMGETIKWVLIGGGVLLLVSIVGLVAYFVMRKRKALPAGQIPALSA